ncbi:hypothetical protein CEN41_01930 [Fischerella thermalis CCMEE 5330]|uniref:Uncharacterized protein n=1 Tax=Fischerella thermalis CCMEE 5330 TaxID=2019670 RepID=A0A2N6MNG2_9CYAN|nr:hypothetical protein CEN41_01930 [Fischerella thermalis CCMEE 5330]
MLWDKGATMVILLGVGLSAMVTALYWRGIRQIDTKPSNKITLLSTHYEDPRIPPQQAADIDPFHDLLEAEGFTFQFHAQIFYSAINETIIESVYFNEDSTISVATIGRIGEFPPALELKSVFADDAMMIVTSPFGERIDMPNFHVRHAYDVLAAIEYHRQYVPTMEAKHGAAVPCLTFSDFERREELYARNYRRHFMSRLRNHLSGQFLRSFAATVLIALLAVADILWGHTLLWDGSVQLGTLMLVLTAVILLGLLLVNNHVETVFQRFPAAIDEGINPPPIIGEASATKKQR